jgi:hypothetical protein
MPGRGHFKSKDAGIGSVLGMYKIKQGGQEQ